MSILKDVLKTKCDDFDAPMTIPEGKWAFEVEDAGATDQKGDSPARVWFVLRPYAAGDDVDQEEAEEYLDGVEDRSPVFHSINVKNREGGYYVREFLRNIGVSIKGRDLEDAVKESAGTKCSATVSHDANEKDPTRPWVRLRGFEAVSAE